MILPKIMNVGVYREAQKSSQISRTWGVGLYLKGKVRQTTYYPDGTIKGTLDAAVDEDVPMLSIGAPDSKPFLNLIPPAKTGGLCWHSPH